MATETVQKYKVSMAFDEAYKKLEKFQRKSASFNKASTAHLKSQKIHLKANTSLLADMLRKEDLIAKQKEKQKNLEHKGRFGQITQKPSTLKASETAFADMLRKEDELARKVAKQPAMDAHLKAREKHINASVRAEEQRVKALERARRIAMRHNIMLGDTKDLQVQLTRQAIRERIAKAKTADEVRDIVKQQMVNLKTMQRATKEQQKQNFLLRRMKSSSQQIAGNMVSAFAIAAGAAGVTRVGQDFESVRNTMLAVSDSAEQSGENFKFVRNEAFRLGLGLKESAKGFAKMVSARGNMTIEQTKEAFTGLSEMSTLLGLSAEESSRATNALMQIDGLPNAEMQ